MIIRVEYATYAVAKINPEKTSALPGFEPGYWSQVGVVLRIVSEGSYRIETKN